MIVNRYSVGVDYEYDNNGKKRVKLHVVTCDETYEAIDQVTGSLKTVKDRYAWISSKTITKKNVVTRCNLMGRSLWSIEEGILTEKKHGYASIVKRTLTSYLKTTSNF